MISILQRANKYKTCSHLWGSWSRIQIPRKRIKDKDALDKVIATVAVSKSATTTDAKAVGPTNNKVETRVRIHVSVFVTSGEKKKHS